MAKVPMEIRSKLWKLSLPYFYARNLLGGKLSPEGPDEIGDNRSKVKYRNI